MTLLSRLHWWTVEYGLVGNLDDPKLYGAGLLSSIGEAAQCLTPAVKKLPYSMAAADVAFDITTMQPQLFVTPDFGHLNAILEQFADTMAFRRGGLGGLSKAHASANVATFQYSSGLQVSGVVSEVLADGDAPIYIRTGGPTALAVAGRQLPGHDKGYHRDGFGSPVGRPLGWDRPLEEQSDEALTRFGLQLGRPGRLELGGGIRVEGTLERVTREDGRVVLLTFADCRVRRGDLVLFDPAWGTYDMAVGERIVSVFHGAADQDAYDQVSPAPKERTIKVEAGASALGLAALYREVRAIREGTGNLQRLGILFRTLRAEHPDDWLLALEILEIAAKRVGEETLVDEVRSYLDARAGSQEPAAHLVRDGLRLLMS
jgi:phenylalanine-4-hydroxylase